MKHNYKINIVVLYQRACQLYRNRVIIVCRSPLQYIHIQNLYSCISEENSFVSYQRYNMRGTGPSSYGAYFCHHSSDNYVDLSDLYVVLSDLYIEWSDLYVDLSIIHLFENIY